MMTTNQNFENNITSFLIENIKVKPFFSKEFLKFLFLHKAYESFVGRMECKAFTEEEKEFLKYLFDAERPAHFPVGEDEILHYSFSWKPQKSNGFVEWFNRRIRPDWRFLDSEWRLNCAKLKRSLKDKR